MKAVIVRESGQIIGLSVHPDSEAGHHASEYRRIVGLGPYGSMSVEVHDLDVYGDLKDYLTNNYGEAAHYDA